MAGVDKALKPEINPRLLVDFGNNRSQMHTEQGPR